MDEKKIAFIVCVNDDAYFEECQFYINRLRVPEGYGTDILAIREADSMCAAYNFAMQSTDAKYKIYLHQDTFIIYENFLDEILGRFREHPEIGMIGMVGGNEMPKSGVAFNAWNEGKVDIREPDMAYHLVCNKERTEDIRVEAIDGFIMITQYDLPWREDLFTHFDFYDVSQAFEFRKAGYEVLVPLQKKPWTVHDCGFCKLGKYDADRKILIKEYANFLTGEQEPSLVYDSEWDKLSSQLTLCIRQMMEVGNWSGAREAIDTYHICNYKSTELERLSVMLEIWAAEGEKQKFFAGIDRYADMYEKYEKVRFWLHRIEFDMTDFESEHLLEEIRRGEVTCEAILVFIVHSVIDKQKMLKLMRQIYETAGEMSNCRKVQILMDTLKDKGVPTVYGAGKRHAQEEKSDR